LSRAKHPHDRQVIPKAIACQCGPGLFSFCRRWHRGGGLLWVKKGLMLRPLPTSRGKERAWPANDESFIADRLQLTGPADV
jgi:hypothetical protein